MFSFLSSRGSADITEHQSNLLYDLVAQTKEYSTFDYLSVAEYVVGDKIKTKNQIQECINFYRLHPTNSLVEKRSEFEAFIGAGVSYSDEQVRNYTADFITKNQKEILANPFDKTLMKTFKEGLKFCDDSRLIKEFNSQAKELIEQYKTNKANQVQEPKKDTKAVKTDDKEEEEFNTKDAEELLKTYDIKKLVAR